MTERAEKAAVTLTITLTPEEVGTLLGCLGFAAERSTVDDRQVIYMELADRMRDAQRDMLGPMSVAEGMAVVREVQDIEKATVAHLRYE